MSAQLFNGIAFDYEQQIKPEFNAKLEMLSRLNLDPQSYQGAEFDLWKHYESQRPSNYQEHGIPGSTANLLSEELLGDFHFPPTGLKGLAKTRLVIQLQVLAESLSLDDQLHAGRIGDITEFLDNNSIVYNYC